MPLAVNPEKIAIQIGGRVEVRNLDGDVEEFRDGGHRAERFLLFRFSATASRMRFFSAPSSILSLSLMSMARLTFPSRLELKRPEGSFKSRTLEECQLDHVLVGLTGTDTPVVGPDRCSGVCGFHPLPLLDDIGIRVLDDSRTLPSVLPRQSPNSRILLSISSEASVLLSAMRRSYSVEVVMSERARHPGAQAARVNDMGR